MHVGIASPQRRGKCSRHSPRMRNPQFYLSGKRPIDIHMFILHFFLLWSSLFITVSYEIFTHIRQSCNTGIGTIVSWSRCQWSIIEGYIYLAHLIHDCRWIVKDISCSGIDLVFRECPVSATRVQVTQRCPMYSWISPASTPRLHICAHSISFSALSAICEWNVGKYTKRSCDFM